MATLDTEESCTIQDISISGLGLVSDRKHSIGQTLDVTLHFEDEDFSGRISESTGTPGFRFDHAAHGGSTENPSVPWIDSPRWKRPPATKMKRPGS